MAAAPDRSGSPPSAAPGAPRAAPRTASAGPATEDLGPGVVLGVDPGTQVIGYGAIRLDGRQFRMVEAGRVRSKASRPAPERLGDLLCGIEEVLDAIQPAVVVVERAFIGRNVHSALRLGEGRGLVLASAARRGLQVAEITPASMKRIVVGNGGAEKSQVAHMVGLELGLDLSGSPHDATDALALALAWLRSRSPLGLPISALPR